MKGAALAAAPGLGRRAEDLRPVPGEHGRDRRPAPVLWSAPAAAHSLNYRFLNGYYVVDRLVDVAELRWARSPSRCVRSPARRRGRPMTFFYPDRRDRRGAVASWPRPERAGGPRLLARMKSPLSGHPRRRARRDRRGGVLHRLRRQAAGPEPERRPDHGGPRPRHAGLRRPLRTGYGDPPCGRPTPPEPRRPAAARGTTGARAARRPGPAAQTRAGRAVQQGRGRGRSPRADSAPFFPTELQVGCKVTEAAAPAALAEALPGAAAAPPRPTCSRPTSRAARRSSWPRPRTQDYLATPLRPPASPWEVKAGTVIPAGPDRPALNSDLPGEVIAQVTEPIYDHATGRTVLIPQGLRLIGHYDSQVA